MQLSDPGCQANCLDHPDEKLVNGSPVWPTGFRNIQGMVFSKGGKLYTSEYGDAIEDEVNLIEKTKNYGWPLF
jgi:glucose/arabinose dehydrogenase